MRSKTSYFAVAFLACFGVGVFTTYVDARFAYAVGVVMTSILWLLAPDDKITTREAHEMYMALSREAYQNGFRAGEATSAHRHAWIDPNAEYLKCRSCEYERMNDLAVTNRP